MKQLVILMTLIVLLLLTVTGVMAVGSAAQSRQLAQRTQQSSKLTASVRELNHEKEALTEQLAQSESQNAGLRMERDAITARLGDALVLLQQSAAFPAQPALLPQTVQQGYTGRQGEPLLRARALENTLQWLITDRAQVMAERDEAIADASALTARYGDAQAALATLTAERDAAIADAGDYAAAIAERDAALADVATLTTERDAAIADAGDYAAAIAERDAALADVATLTAQRDAAIADAGDYAAAIAERDAALADVATLTAQRDAAIADAGDYAAAIAERDAALAEVATLTAQRDAALAQLSIADTQPDAAFAGTSDHALAALSPYNPSDAASSNEPVLSPSPSPVHTPTPSPAPEDAPISFFPQVEEWQQRLRQMLSHMHSRVLSLTDRLQNALLPAPEETAAP